MSQQLHRVTLVHNPKYQRSGLKSYGYLLKKFQIEPTNVGPFITQITAEHQSKFKEVLAKITHRDAPEERHVLLKQDLDSGKVGEVEAEDIQNDSLYLCEVSIGSPAQKLMLDFDTGSSDLWVWSTKLPESIQQSGSGHHIFNPDASTSFHESKGSTWKITYGDGSSASGIVGTDNVTVGGLTIKDQAVELANQMSAQFQRGAGDGLLGLAFGKINNVKPTRVQTPVENMISQSDIKPGEELFTAYLNSWHDTDQADQGESFYTFGYIDQDVLAATQTTANDIWYTAVDNSRGFWQFASTAARVNGNTIQLPGNTAIADTGTTLALVSDQLCEAIYKSIPGAKYDRYQQGYVYPASTSLEHLPFIKVDVGGKLFHIHKEGLGFSDAGNGMVYGGVQSRGNLPFDILGDVFLKSVYAIFDQGNKRFGALQRHVTKQHLNLPPAQTS